MATILPTTNRSEGVEDVYRSALRFLRRYNKAITFDLTKPDARRAVEEIWDGIGDLDYRSLLTGSLQTSLPDDFLKLLVYAVVAKQYGQYTSTLSVPGPPSIS